MGLRKILIAALAVFAMSCQSPKREVAEVAIIPNPQQLVVKEGNFELEHDDAISINSEDARRAAEFLKSSLGLSSDIETNLESAKVSIEIAKPRFRNEEAFSVVINEKRIKIQAASDIGAFWGVQTLRQLVPSSLYAQEESYVFPCANVWDAPTFEWRESMLDVGRSFMSVDFVKRYIDWLSYYKMNVFHWHLTEDQGWRIEIKKYPKLTEVGSKRHFGDGSSHEGYYTQEEIREVVAYAAERNITVIPEIEFPGHSQAALASYPELSCTGGPFEVRTTFGVAKDVYCAGNEDVFTFATDVLDEVLELFPSEYIHIGGDECPKDRWKACKKCQARIRKEGLKDEFALQSYFIRRLESYLNNKGRKLIGWDETLEGGLAPNATMQVWRNVKYGKEAIEQGHDIISSPTSHCYFDYDPTSLTTQKVYSFNPVPEGITFEESKHVLGGSGNIWTEYIPEERFDYMVFPRIIALAEALWTKNKDYSNFSHRLNLHYPTLHKAGVQYGPEGKTFKLEEEKNEDALTVKLEKLDPGIEVRYTTDGSTPALTSEILQDASAFNAPVVLTAQAFKNDLPYGDPQVHTFVKSQSNIAKVTYNTKYAEQYTAGGDAAMIDGIKGTAVFGDGRWQAYLGDDMDITMSWDAPIEAKKVKVGALRHIHKFIFPPKSLEVLVSEDGKTFQSLGVKSTEDTSTHPQALQRSYEVEIGKSNIKAIRLKVHNYGVCPADHPGAGGPTWMFIDEVEVI